MGEDAGEGADILLRNLGRISRRRRPLRAAIVHEHFPRSSWARVDQQNRPPAANRAIAGLRKGPPRGMEHARGMEKEEPRAPSSRPRIKRLGESGGRPGLGRCRARGEAVLAHGSAVATLGKPPFNGHRRVGRSAVQTRGERKSSGESGYPYSEAGGTHSPECQRRAPGVQVTHPPEGGKGGEGVCVCMH